MKKTKKKKKKVPKDLRPKTPGLPEKKEEVSYRNEMGADRILPRLKYRELKEACILRGMSPKDVVEADHHRLASFFVENYDKGEDPSLLIAFDQFVEADLESRGHKKGDMMLSPSLRLSYVGKIEDAKEIKVINKPKPETPKKPQEPPKPKREKDETTGIMKGTKKALLFELVKKKWKLEKIMAEVLKQFPTANEKSMKIWYKQAKEKLR